MKAPLDLIGDRIRLRSAVASDADRLLEIRSTPEVRRWWRGDDIARELEENLADDETCHLCIEVDGGVVGIMWGPRRRDGYASRVVLQAMGANLRIAAANDAPGPDRGGKLGM